MTSSEIKKKREAMGLSQKELAALIGVGKNTIYNYESGGKIPESKISILESVLSPNYRQNKNTQNAQNTFYEKDKEIRESQIPNYIVENEDRLLTNNVFRLWLTTKIQEGVIKALKNS